MNCRRLTPVPNLRFRLESDAAQAGDGPSAPGAARAGPASGRARRPGARPRGAADAGAGEARAGPAGGDAAAGRGACRAVAAAADGRRSSARRSGARPEGRRCRGPAAGPSLHTHRAPRRRPGADDALHPRRWLDVRRPREPRRPVPVPRREVRRPGAGDRLPALAGAQVPRGGGGLPGGVPLAGRACRRGQRRPGPPRRRRRLGRWRAVRLDRRLGGRAGPAAALPAADLPRHGLGRAHRRAARCSGRASS